MILNGKAICIKKLNELRSRRTLITFCKVQKHSLSQANRNAGMTRIGTPKCLSKKKGEKMGLTNKRYQCNIPIEIDIPSK